MGRKAAHQFVMRPKAAKWLIIVQKGLYPVFGKHPEFGEFTLFIFYGKSITVLIFHTYSVSPVGGEASLLQGICPIVVMGINIFWVECPFKYYEELCFQLIMDQVKTGTSSIQASHFTVIAVIISVELQINYVLTVNFTAVFKQ